MIHQFQLFRLVKLLKSCLDRRPLKNQKLSSHKKQLSQNNQKVPMKLVRYAWNMKLPSRTPTVHLKT